MTLEEISKRIVFVSFENGGGGHRMARVIATLPQMYWYSCKENGIHPWNTYFKETSIRQRYVTPAHFDRIVPNGKLPPTHDYVKDFFECKDTYYKLFAKKFSQVAPDTDKKFVYCTHSLPNELMHYFPHSKVLNMYNVEVDKLVERYLKTTAIFPGYVRQKGLVEEDNNYLMYLEEMKSKYKGFTFRDLWAKEKFNTLYKESYQEEYKKSLLKIFQNNISNRENCFYNNVLNVHSYVGWKDVKTFLNISACHCAT